MGERIAVLGAGPMGLAAAYQLAADGHVPVLFEAGDRVGGMAASFDFSGVRIERYYHFHCTSDVAFLDLLEELGMADQVCWTRTKMAYWYQGRMQPWGNPWALLRFRGLGLISKFRYGLHAFVSTKRSDWQRLDRLSGTQWLHRWVGDRAFEVLWRKLFELKFYHLSDRVSAAWIWSRIRRLGRSRYNLFHEKLGFLQGGSDTLLTRLEKEIEAAGGDVRLSSPVEQVVLEGGRLQGVRLRSGEFEAFDKVISTIPLPYLPQILSGLPDDIVHAYRSVENVAVVCVIAKLAKPVSENFWVNINDPEMDIPGIVEYTNLRPLDGGHIVYVPFYMPGDIDKYSDPDDVFLDKVRRYLKRMNPVLEDADFLDIRAHRYRFAQPIGEPGFLDKLPPVALPVKGLWVADTSYYYPEDRGISESVEFGRGMARSATAG